MASTVRSIVILAAYAFLVLETLVLATPISTPSPKTSVTVPTPLDVNVIYVKEREDKPVVRAFLKITDVTTTISLNKVVTEVTDGVGVLKLTKEGEDMANKVRTINDNKITTQENTNHLKKRSAMDSSINGENGGNTAYMTMVNTDENGHTQELSERWGAHGGYHGHGSGGHRHYGNGDFIQIPFVPVKIPSISSSVDSAFTLFDGFLGGGNRDDGHRTYHHPNHDRTMGGHHGFNQGWGNGGMNDWHGHGHNHGNNGRWPYRPHNHNCHGSDESDEDDSNEKPRTKQPIPTTRAPWTSTSKTRYTTTKTTTPSTTTDYPDIDIRFGDGGSTTEVDPNLPAAV